jgi:hypothetical protein
MIYFVGVVGFEPTSYGLQPYAFTRLALPPIYGLFTANHKAIIYR